MYNFTIRNWSWYKRRLPTEQKQIVEFKVENFKLEEDSRCIVYIRYDGETIFKELSGRVCQNPNSKKFTINGLNPYGDYIILDVS